MNIMIDIETMSSRNNAAVASIGACLFNPDLHQSIDELSMHTFLIRLDLSKQRGRDFDGDTIYWWLKQSPEAIADILQSPQLILQGLDLFSEFCKGHGPAWSYGATFDHVIIQDLYNWIKMKNPIHYRDMLCMRTIIKLSGIECPVELNDAGIRHRAVDDCIRQAYWLQRALTGLRGK